MTTIDDLLCAWHKWADKWSPCAGYRSSAMFTGVKSSRQFDSSGEVADASIHNMQMKAVEFHISEMSMVHRAALQTAARNLATGASVWRSQRLPDDPQKVSEIVTEAKVELIKRLGID